MSGTLRKGLMMMKGKTTEVMSIPSRDGQTLLGKLDLPAQTPVQRLVVFVNGSGPNTYDNQRDKGDGALFRYYDLFAQELTNKGIGFFRYNTRGCSDGPQPPFYCSINWEEYQTYYPETSAWDLEDWITYLHNDPRCRGAKTLLLGWSEGTMIAPLVALRGYVPVDGLLLAGYVNGTLEETLEWQQQGNGDLVFYRQYFDLDGDGVITREEFEADTLGVKEALGITFEELDLNGDGLLTLEDFANQHTQQRKEIYQAIEAWDDAWLREHYPVPLTAKWFHEHRKLRPNRETLPSLALPIHIFQGVFDANTRVEDTYDIRDTFTKLGKDNLTAHIYPDANHNLNYEQWLYGKGLPHGLKDIFHTCETL